MRQTLLPINATELERKCEATLARSANLPVLIDRVWDPQCCPEALLPWLAWALSVDSWESHWPDQTKRDLIAQSVHVHRTKGSVSAIKRVLSSLGVRAELSEWFESGGKPYTFELTAWVNANLVANEQPILNPGAYQMLQRSIDQVKPVRAHYTFRVGVAFNSGINLACMVQSMTIVSLRMEFV